MIINDQIVIDYINEKSVDNYKGRWFFERHSGSLEELSFSQKKIEAVKRIYNVSTESISKFRPCNKEIWDVLFPDWEEIIEDTIVELVVGLPEPNDAMVLEGPEGKIHVILDLALWVKYEECYDISDLVHNLLTHELCHVCIGEVIPEIDNDIESPDYILNLDANTFHEGFAHLLSFEGKELREINLTNDRWQVVAAKSRQKMLSALEAEKKSDQEKFLRKSLYGNYQDKFACMCGMLYLYSCWKKQGVNGLKESSERGYHGFASLSAQGII